MTHLEISKIKENNTEVIELILWQAKRDGDSFVIAECKKLLNIK